MKRCKTCRYWQQPSEDEAEDMGYGAEVRLCERQGTPGSHFRIDRKWCEYGPCMAIEPDFGCVDHEPI